MNDIAQGTGNDSPVAATILVLILAIGLAGLRFAPRIIGASLLRPWVVARGGKHYTLIACGFVHASLGHLLFNALALWSFGFPLERQIGSVRFLLLYVGGLLISSLGTVYRQRNNPDYASLGASGAILAVVFASILYFPLQTIFVMFVPMPAWLFALGYLAYSVYASRFARDHVNHDAHLDGALAGILFVLVTEPTALGRALSLLF